MTKKIVFIIICFSIVLILPKHTLSQTLPGGTIPGDWGHYPPNAPSDSSLACVGTWAKIICITNQVANYIRTIDKITTAIDYVPHSFPFGGPVLSSEQACKLKFKAYVYVPNPACFIPGGQAICAKIPTVPVPIPIPFPMPGFRAIRVGEPVPVIPPTTSPYGRVITFPWISQIYDQHTENRAGPWALGLGFTPFPLKDINDSLKGLIIWILPQAGLGAIGCPDVNFSHTHFWGDVCITDFQFDCLNSGDKDANGEDIYKVIRKLGTSLEDAPAEAFPPGFTLP